ncbi:hypothetical protein LIER_28360 [Lithospermum erythrorhizon]|uniref:Rho termination factor N-terminal domain-containing protein n=1 Tax=Lithospermum erythrorhizon TaxID=34254 RepID=A0AAV3RGJ3_LITER
MYEQIVGAPMRSPSVADDIGEQKVSRRILDPESAETKKVSDPLQNDEMEELSANPQQIVERIFESNGCNSSINSIENIVVDSSAMGNKENLENPDGKYDRNLTMERLSSSFNKGKWKINCSKIYESKRLERADEKETASSVAEIGAKTAVSIPSSDPRLAQKKSHAVEKVAGSAPTRPSFETEAPVCFEEVSRKKPVLSLQRKMETNTPIIKGKFEGFTELEPISVDALIELVNGRNDAATQHKKVKGKLHARRTKEPEACRANFYIKKECTNLKSGHHVKPDTVEQSLADEFGLAAGLGKNKKHKSGTGEKFEFNNKNIKNNGESDLIGTKLADNSLTSIINPVTHTPNSNRKHSVLPLSYENEDSGNLQIVPAKMHDNEDFGNLQIVPAKMHDKIQMEESIKVISCSPSTDSIIKIAEERIRVPDLEYMTMDKLKNIARYYKLTGYSKLTKTKLLSFLENKLKVGSLQQ